MKLSSESDTVHTYLEEFRRSYNAPLSLKRQYYQLADPDQ